MLGHWLCKSSLHPFYHTHVPSASPGKCDEVLEPGLATPALQLVGVRLVSFEGGGRAIGFLQRKRSRVEGKCW